MRIRRGRFRVEAEDGGHVFSVTVLCSQTDRLYGMEKGSCDKGMPKSCVVHAYSDGSMKNGWWWAGIRARVDRVAARQPVRQSVNRSVVWSWYCCRWWWWSAAAGFILYCSRSLCLRSLVCWLSSIYCPSPSGQLVRMVSMSIRSAAALDVGCEG